VGILRAWRGAAVAAPTTPGGFPPDAANSNL
jgi:hypothetical protein